MHHTNELVGISTSQMRRMYKTHVYISAHLLCRMRQCPKHLIAYWPPCSKHRLNPVTFLPDRDPGPIEQIQWHCSQVAQAGLQLMRKYSDTRVEKFILLRQQVNCIESQYYQLC